MFNDVSKQEQKDLIVQAIRDANAGSLIVRETTGEKQAEGLTADELCRRFRVAPDQVQPLLQELVSAGTLADLPAAGARNRVYVLA